jgi:hypothetical protein
MKFAMILVIWTVVNGGYTSSQSVTYFASEDLCEVVATRVKLKFDGTWSTVDVVCVPVGTQAVKP